jgi:diaminopimelate decarboxylase
MNNLVRPAMYGAWHQPMLTKNNIDTNGAVEKYDIVGPICESGDIFAKDVLLNKITDENNYVAFMYAGAYGKSMASNYNLHDIATEIMVDGSSAKVISKPIRWEDLLRFEMA